jgi:hypothetical protein
VTLVDRVASGSGRAIGHADGVAALGLGRGSQVDPPPPSRPFPGVVRQVLRYLALGLVGVVVMLGGLVWDAVRHAGDPSLAHTEGSLFTLSSPPHVALVGGAALAVAGLTLATVRALPLSAGRRLSSPRTGMVLVMAVVVLVAGAIGAARWASGAQLPIATGPLAPANPEHHGIGIVDSHAPGPCRPTQADKDGAARLITATEEGTAKYRSFAAAIADGYVGPANPTVTEHYFNIPYTLDGRVLDMNRPESLMYTPTSHGMVLVGAMFFTNIPGEFGPEPGGCLTRWHVHANLCYSSVTFAVVGTVQEPGDTCPAGQYRYIPPPALHVWFYDVPGGRFAPEVDPAYLAKKLG